MRSSTWLPLTVALLGLASQAHAWTFVWFNPANDSTVDTANSVRECMKIDLHNGSDFSWDPESSFYCLSLYSDDHCGNRNGYSCPIWQKTAGRNVSSYEIKLDPALQSSSTASLPTTTSTAAPAPATVTSTPSNTATPGGSGSDISGGAIAGIVIGVLAALAIAAAVLYFVFRRRRGDPDTKAEAAVEAPAAATQDSQARMHITPPPMSPMSEMGDHPPKYGARTANLQELAGSTGVNELEGSSPVATRDEKRW